MKLRFPSHPVTAIVSIHAVFVCVRFCYLFICSLILWLIIQTMIYMCVYSSDVGRCYSFAECTVRYTVTSQQFCIFVSFREFEKCCL